MADGAQIFNIVIIIMVLFVLQHGKAIGKDIKFGMCIDYEEEL